MMSRITSAGRAIWPKASAGRPDRSAARRQLLRFLVIGSTAVVIDLLMYHLLLQFGVRTGISKGLSYLSGMAFGFIGNKFWTFESKSKSLTEPALYILLYTITLGVNVAVNGLTLWAIGSDQKLIAFLFATGVTTVLNFIGMKWVTFRERQHPKQEG